VENSLSGNEVTLAILPFENLTEGNGLDILCKSFHIDLVTELSRFRQFRVLAQESIQGPGTVAADYTIKGSFRHHNNDVLRINAQLLKTATNEVAWADRYEGDQESIFSIQEDLLREIVSSLQQQLNYDLLIHIRKKAPINLTAYECWLYGMEELKKGTLDADQNAREHFQKAIEIDPTYSLAYSGMSLTYFNEWSCQLWQRWDVCQKGAFDWAKKAIQLDEQNYVAALVLGRIYLYEAQYDTGEHYLRRALRLNPNDIDNLIQIALCFVYLGYVKEAEKLYTKVLQLNPLNQNNYNATGAVIAFELGEYEKCLALGENLMPPWVDFSALIAAAYFMIGDQQAMQKRWNVYLNDFREKILKGGEVDEKQALQWIINVTPIRHQTNLLPFWEHIMGNKVSLSSRVFSKAAETVVENSFLKENEMWQISFEGKTVFIPEVKGFVDMAKLLEYPEKEFHCTSLLGNGVQMTGELVFDEKARQSYKRKIQDLQDEIKQCEDHSNFDRAAELQLEYDSLVDHLSASLGMGGKTRKINDPMDKMRSAVTWRIRNAIQKIEKSHPSLGKHFTHAIKTGLFCAYKPEKPVKWVLSR
jgi:TolB-like protein